MGIIVMVSILATVISIIGILYAVIKKRKRKPFLKALAVSVAIGIAGFIGAAITMTPEERAAANQHRIERQQAADQKKADKEKAAADDKAQKEQASADAALQKKYDDQADYEAWIAQQEKDKADAELQKKYDDQADYEAWIAQKENSNDTSYDSQPAQADVQDEPSPPPVTAPVSTEKYLGNPKSMKFHHTWCKTIKHPERFVKLESRDEAVSSGYHPCGVCLP